MAPSCSNRRWTSRLPSSSLRVRLAGEDQLHRAVVVAEQRQRAVDVAQQQVEPLVGRDAAGEADREHVGVERRRRPRGRTRACRRGRGGRSRCASRTRSISSRRCARRAAHSSASGMRVDAAPRSPGRRRGPSSRRRGGGRAARASGAPIQVGMWTPLVTCAIGTSSTGAVGPQVVPHLARDLAVAGADAVGDPARAQRELGHAERLGLLVGVRAAAADERVRRRRPARRRAPPSARAICAAG